MKSNTTPLLSREPNKAMQEMMDIIDSLKTVMVEEIDALNNANTGEFINLQDKKLIAAKTYHEGVSEIIARKDEMKLASQALKSQLENMRVEFAITAEENIRALERMRKGMQRFSDRIMNAARKEAESKQKFVYGAHGKMEGSSKASIGINERA